MFQKMNALIMNVVNISGRILVIFDYLGLVLHIN